VRPNLKASLTLMVYLRFKPPTLIRVEFGKLAIISKGRKISKL
jgi:hypothetical protein